MSRRPDPTVAVERRWTVTGDRYVLDIPDAAIEISVDRLRRKFDELHGELTVRCDLRGARTFEGVLSVADFNLSSIRARQERAKHLGERARTPEIDWLGLLEEFVQRVFTAERTGLPAVMLREVPRPAPDSILEIDGLPILERHPIVLFGDGGSAKSYLALYLAGRLAQHGIRTGLFDWELAGEDHRDRYERLFGLDMPRQVWYVRCTRPLAHEADRLRRIVQEQGLDYAIFDSIAFACDGPPEAAEVAGRYFQAVRTIGVGSLHVAHVSKAEGADQKPFGSTFWHNGARSTWAVKLADSVPGSNQITVGLYNRKANLGGLKPAIGYSLTFDADRTTIDRIDLADVPDLASKLPVAARMRHLLQRGAMTVQAIAAELEVPENTIRQAAKRKDRWFTRVPDPSGVYRIGLMAREA